MKRILSVGIFLLTGILVLNGLVVFVGNTNLVDADDGVSPSLITNDCESLESKTSDVPTTVLAELFTGTWCTYCQGAEGALDRLADEYPRNNLTVIEWHNGDDYAPADGSGEQREDFYGVSAFPTAYFDGVERIEGGSSNPDDEEVYNNYKEVIDNQLNTSSPLIISGTGRLNDSAIMMDVEVKAIVSITESNLYVHFVLYEDHNESVYVDSKEYRLRYTALKSLNSSITLSEGDTINLHKEFSLDPAWTKEKLGVVTFVQTHNKEAHINVYPPGIYYTAKVLQAYDLKILIQHAPIYINGDSNFTSTNGVTSGNGSASNPYIIENWDINASGANGIEIRNTDAYFVIRNCILHDGKTNYNGGIYFYNVTNSKIDNIASYKNSDGIGLGDSSNSNTISNCDVRNNVWDGIVLGSSSNNNAISHCAVYNNSYNGIYLEGSSNNEIHYCNIYGNTNYGVYSYGYSVNVTYNWWGSANGPGGVGPGSGDNVSANVLYNPWIIMSLDFLPPTVVSTQPSNSAVDVPVDLVIVITFSEPMNISTIPGNITITPDVQIQNYIWSNENKILTLILASNLSSYTQYTVTINTNVMDGVMDSDGVVHSFENMQQPYQFTFRTKEDIISPEIVNIQSTLISQEIYGYVNITAFISDNAMVNLVCIDITYPNGTWLGNFSMTGVDLDGNRNGTYYHNAQYSVLGTYSFYIWANDSANNGNKSEEFHFLIKDTTHPIANAGPDKEVNEDIEVELNASLSWDKVGIVNWNWSFIHQGMPVYLSGKVVYYTFAQPGYYTITLNVSDASSNWAVDILNITVKDISPPGIANIQTNPSIQTQGGYVNISCIVSDNVAVNIVNITISGHAEFTPINITMTRIGDTNNYYYNSTFNIAGDYSYYIWTVDTSGSGNKSTEYYFTIKPEVTTIVDGKELNITGAWTGTINITSVALPPTPPENVDDIGIFIEVNLTGALEYANITIKYNDSDITGVDESKLRMYYWNVTENKWKLCENTDVDAVNNIVWANVTHLTIFAPMAEKVAGAQPGPVNWLLQVGIIAVVILLATVAVVIIWRRKKQV